MERATDAELRALAATQREAVYGTRRQVLESSGDDRHEPSSSPTWFVPYPSACSTVAGGSTCES